MLYMLYKANKVKSFKRCNTLNTSTLKMLYAWSKNFAYVHQLTHLCYTADHH